jgi:hypothetical protein
VRALNAAEREMFGAIRNSPDIALVSTELDGEETGVIVAVVPGENGSTMVYPLAVLLTETMKDRLTGPDGETELTS